jgi:hypothetical protein
MKVKNFKDFSDSMNESEWHLYRGKTPFSRWLRKMDDGFASMWQTKNDKEYVDDVWAKAIPLIGSLVTGAGAAISDFFFKGKDREKYSSMTSSALKNTKKDVLSDWEKEQIGDKKINYDDAKDFYKSGVLKGKKYFGKNFDPKKPKTDDEKEYVDYLTSAMKKYYEKLK